MAKAAASKTKKDTKAKGAGRPKVAISVTDLRKAAKMKKGGSTWQEIRDELGVKTSSGRFHELWAENDIDAPEVRERKAPGSKGKKGKKGKGKKAASPS